MLLPGRARPASLASPTHIGSPIAVVMVHTSPDSQLDIESERPPRGNTIPTTAANYHPPQPPRRRSRPSARTIPRPFTQQFSEHPKAAYAHAHPWSLHRYSQRAPRSPWILTKSALRSCAWLPRAILQNLADASNQHWCKLSQVAAECSATQQDLPRLRIADIAQCPDLCFAKHFSSDPPAPPSKSLCMPRLSHYGQNAFSLIVRN